MKDGLLPIDLVLQNEKLHVVCLPSGSRYFQRPFFVDDLKFDYGIITEGSNAARSVMVKPFDYRFATLEVSNIPVIEFIARHECELENLLFVFHISRCGSTLMTQMLSNVKRFQVLSEPSVVNQILNPELDIPLILREKLLRSVFCSFYDNRPEHADYVVIKFRSWQTLMLENIKNWFPITPFIFVHRDCQEVAASLIQKPAGWLRSRAKNKIYFSRLLSIHPKVFDGISDVEFIARILGAFFIQFQKTVGSSNTIIDYNLIKYNVISMIERLLDITFTDSECLAALTNIHIYSKDIGRSIIFEDDSDNKKALWTTAEAILINDLAEQYRFSIINLWNSSYQNS